ncbi:MAG: hypothetical protein MUE68_06080 [Bacteroidetes bacterium]|jgi:hypothetical protein|nr:hypothetical protein [Bacteroidota bacterium]
MTTKPPSKVQPFDAATRESLAYGAAALIATREPNDQARLGYCIWGWLTERRGTLAEAIRSSGVRTDLHEREVIALVSGHLGSNGVNVV